MTQRSPMDALRAYWSRRRAAIEREPTVGMAMLGGRGAWTAWALHRLRGLGIVRLGAAALHIVEALILLRSLDAEVALSTFALTNAAAVLTGAWWGATELLRDRLRTTRDGGRADALCVPWLVWSMRLGLCLLGLSAMVFVVGLDVTGAPLAGAYAALAFLRAAVDLPLRVYHSRIYAYRRVYRSPLAQLGVEAVGPIAAVLLATPLGPAGIIVALTLSAAASRLLTVHYIGRALAQMGRQWLRPRLRLRAAGRDPTPLPSRDLLLFALAGVASRLPNVLVVLLLLTPAVPVNIALGLHLVVGLLLVATAWPWTHYHDLLPLDLPILGRLRLAMERRLLGESVAVGLIAAALASIGFALLTPTDLVFVPADDIFVLIPPELPDPWPWAPGPGALAFGLAMLAGAQLVAWRRGHTVTLAVGTALVVVSALLAPKLAAVAVPASRFENTPPPLRLIVEHVTIAAAMVVASTLTFVRAARPISRTLTGNIAWLEAIARTEASSGTWFRIELLRGGAIGEAVSRAIASHAIAWARKGRTLLVLSEDPRGLRRAALTTGWVSSLTPHAPSISSPTTGDHLFRLHISRRGRITRTGPPPSPPWRREMWRVLLLWVRFGARSRDVRIVDHALEDGTLSEVAFQHRSLRATPSDGT